MGTITLYCIVLRICRSQNFGDAGALLLGTGAWLTPRKMPLSTCYHAKFGRSRSNGTSVRTEICRNNGPLASRLWNTSLEPTPVDLTYDFVLVTHTVIMNLSCIVSETKGRLGLKSHISLFPYLTYRYIYIYIIKISKAYKMLGIIKRNFMYLTPDSFVML